ncbi:MAG: glycogen synthase [Parasporobacterium sp.]|nr:glycogen synthase [Parasporobacterium sp.]
MQILFEAFEAAPFMKTGGLADVAGSMPPAVKALGADIRVMLPKSSLIPAVYAEKMTYITSFFLNVAWRNEYCGVFSLEHNGITFYFIDNEKYFYRGQLYGELDDAERMAFFSKACLEACLHLNDFAPDIIHCNDWHTALTPVFLREFYRDTKLGKARTVYTIHNLKFQGLYDPYIIGDVLGLHNTPADAQLRQSRGYSTCCNFMLGACLYSDRITTVSPTYAEEIATEYFGEGLDWLFRKRKDRLQGILNGIDYTDWNPETDPYLTANYSIDNFREEKVKNKTALQADLGLEVNPDIPMFAIISRLTEQKGLDLVTYLLPHITSSNMQLVVLGIGDNRYEEAFSWYSNLNSDKISAQIKFDNSLSHRLYAAADVMLIPSRFEPCGLTQLISMRYGTLPLVRETGGLKDTVDNTTGFSFVTFNADDMKYALDCALDVWNNKREEWEEKQEKGMKSDFSWDTSAQTYLKLYQDMLC